MIIFTKEQIIKLHSYLLENTGGLDGIRDENMLDLAVNSPYQTFGGFDLYPTNIEKIAKLSYNLTTLHCFFDGNKRIGANVLLLQIEASGLDFLANDDEIINEFLSLAAGDLSYEEFLEWVISNAVNIKKDS